MSDANCYYHDDKPAIFTIIIENCGTIRVCVSCHAILKEN